MRYSRIRATIEWAAWALIIVSVWVFVPVQT